MRNKRLQQSQNSRRKNTEKLRKNIAFPPQVFHIESIDSLGQGVAKQGDQVTFVAKTLPTENVVAQIVKKKKGVSFAVLNKIETEAENRINPECEHYAQCPGCHFLHTDYESELLYKKQSLERMIKKLAVDSSQIKVIPALSRFGYRNRLQLHYRQSQLGLVDGLNDRIVEIPRCRLIRDQLNKSLNDLYENRSWADTYKGDGHCEIYLKGDEVSTEWNSTYAHGGFTQVFDEMNQQLCGSVNEYLAEPKIKTVLDLFAGNGNLSQQLVQQNNVRRTMVDSAVSDGEIRSHNIDLLSEDALKKFQAVSTESQFDAVLVDPPRKGFPALWEWVKNYKPRKLVYVSCNASTMVRDLLNLRTKVSMDKVELIDLFPSTYHFETICFISFDHK